VGELGTKFGLVGMTRVGSVFLARLCRNETKLWCSFFGESESESETLRNLLFKLCEILHSTVRKGLVKVVDLDMLAQIVSVLREEAGPAAAAATASSQTLSLVIGDAQERLIFVSTTQLKKTVTSFKPTKQTASYPEIIMTAASKLKTAVEENDVEVSERSERALRGKNSINAPPTQIKSNQSNSTPQKLPKKLIHFNSFGAFFARRRARQSWRTRGGTRR